MQLSFFGLFGLVTLATATNSVQINFYSDTGCAHYLGNRVIQYSGQEISNGGTYNQGGPFGSKGGLFVNLGCAEGACGVACKNLVPVLLVLLLLFLTIIADAAFKNSANDAPFTGDLSSGECIGSNNGIVAYLEIH